MHEARCFVEVSRSQIAANYRVVRDAVAPGAQVIGVVKANAYGHGAVEVARVLKAEGIRWLAVSSVDEGVALRDADIDCRILVMAGVMPWERGAVVQFGLRPVIHSLDELKAYAEFNDVLGPMKVHLKIDTGMDRLGTREPAGAILAAMEASPEVKVEGLMSHFASATDFSSTQTEDQLRAFQTVADGLAARGFRPEVMHFCSTNAIAYPRSQAWGKEAWMQLVRPGHALYGYVSPTRGPAPQAVFAVKPALQWKARIIMVKDVPAGAHVGYGGSYLAESDMRIAVLAAGYADGILHRLSNKGKVIAGGRLAPIVGTVSMDVTTVDITQSPWLKPGDEVTLLGREGDVSLDAQQIARTGGTISYNVLSSIGSRVKRFYVD